MEGGLAEKASFNSTGGSKSSITSFEFRFESFKAKIEKTKSKEDNKRPTTVYSFKTEG